MRKLFLFLISILVLTVLASAQVTVNWDTANQVIEGFGASCAFNESLNDTQADLFFSTVSGAGLSLLRAQVPDDGASPPTVTCGPTMQKAVARGARVWSTPWSPPASMKDNGSVNNGGHLLAGSYQAYADYLTNYVKQVKSLYGVDLYALSVQNEPDYTPTYDSAIWSAQNFHDFILNNLGPDLVSNGLATKIIMPEQMGWTFDLATTTMSDPAAAAYVSIIAAHNYNGTVSASPYPSKEIWETEVSTFDNFDPSMTNGLAWAEEIHSWLTVAHVSAWHYWWLYPGNGFADNEGLTDTSFNPAKRLYVLGQWSRFVRPGWYNVGVTNSTGLEVTAFKNATNDNGAIVTINNTGSPITTTFTVGTTLGIQVVPWLTSSTQNIASQASIAISKGSFSATIPAQSVETFVGSGGAQPQPPPAPTGLAVVVN